MTGIKELQARIKSVNDTKKVTHALYLISSTKLIAGRTRLTQYRAYSRAIRREYAALCGPVTEPAPDATRMLLVLTPDRGFTGDFTKAIVREAEKWIRSHPDAPVTLFGEQGAKLFRELSLPFRRDPSGSSLPAPDPEGAARLADLVRSLAADGCERIEILYTGAHDGFRTRTAVRPVWPPQPKPGRPEDRPPAEAEYLPSKEAVRDALASVYLQSTLLEVLLASYVAEQNARMLSMSAATDNAEDLLTELTRTLNRLRQNRITQEVAELSGNRHGSI